MAEQDTKRRPEDTSHPGQASEDIHEENRDPISGAPGAHPVGVGVGAAAGGAAGAAIGSVVPGAGTVIGGAIGLVLGALGGGLAGKSVAEAIDPTTEEAYWRSELPNRPYFNQQYTYDGDYAPAYGYGYATRFAYMGGPFEASEAELRDNWPRFRGESRLDWEQAREPVQDAWRRLDEQNKARDAQNSDEEQGREPARRNPAD